MEKVSTGIIRKIIIGANPKEALAFEIGRTFITPMGELKVVEIVEDQANFYFFGNIRYLIYAEKEDKTIFVWKYFERHATIVECVI